MASILKSFRPVSDYEQPRLDLFNSHRKEQAKIDCYLDFASHKAAEYACQNWHYSTCLPAGKKVKIGVWENNRFIGVVVFSRGSNPRLGQFLDLPQCDICELSRIALRKHKTPVSRIIRIALKLLRQQSPNLKAVISYADCCQNHIGSVYQASNWFYLGQVKSFMIEATKDGQVRRMHGRSFGGLLKRAGLTRMTCKKAGISYKNIPEHRFKYVMNFEDKLREQLERLNKTYPKCV